jgi:transposase
MPNVMGLDLGVTSATHFAIADGMNVTTTFTTASTPDGLTRAIRKASNGQPVDVVVESTAMSWFVAAVAAERSNVPHTLYRVSGRKAAALRSFYQAYTKTDRIDARVLARMPLVDEGLRTFTLPTRDELALKRLVNQRHKVIKERTRTKGRIRSTFHWVAPGLLGKHGVTPGFLAILKRWPDLRALARARVTSLTKQGSLTREQAEKLRSRVHHAVAFYQDRVDWSTLALEFELAIEHHELLDTHLARIEQRVKDLHDHAFPNDPLRTLPGVGPVVASTVRAMVGDAREFTNLAAFRAYTGLVPRENSSGDTRRQGRISKAGPNLLRWVLYLAADTARRKDPQLADLYRRLMTERGRHHHQAVCAVASHLVGRIWAVIRENRPYQYQDLEGNALTPAEAHQLARSLAVDAKTRTRLRNNKSERGRDASRSRQPKAPQDHAPPSPTNLADLALEIAEAT